MSGLWRTVLTVLAVVAACVQSSYGRSTSFSENDGSTPFQILKPDETHKKLVFNQGAREILQSIPSNPKGSKF